MGNSKWIHMMFVGGGLLLGYVLVQFTGWMWSLFSKPKELYVNGIGIASAAVVSIGMWRNKRMFERATEITNELAKVTWPTRKETSSATIVVIITTIIISLILGLFDIIWSWATDLIYN